jgi:hypothetical protein
MSGVGSQIMIADLGRAFRTQNQLDDDNDDDNVDNESVEKPVNSETLAMERDYFNLARDMNEVLVSAIHDAAARGMLCVNDCVIKRFQEWSF